MRAKARKYDSSSDAAKEAFDGEQARLFAMYQHQQTLLSKDRDWQEAATPADKAAILKDIRRHVLDFMLHGDIQLLAEWDRECIFTICQRAYFTLVL